MIISLLYWALRRLFELAALGLRSSAAKEVEIVVLRHQLHVLKRQLGRAQLADSDRALAAGLEPLRPLVRQAGSPDQATSERLGPH